MKIHSFKELIVWQKSMALCKSIYELTAQLPAEERFGLISQLRRAAISIPCNIAEGHGRRTTGEFRNAVGIAMGSLRELQTCVLLCQVLGYIEDVDNWTRECDDMGRLIYRFEESLDK